MQKNENFEKKRIREKAITYKSTEHEVLPVIS